MSADKLQDNTSTCEGLSFMTKLQYSAHSFITKFAYHSDGTVNRFLVNLADIRSPPSSTPVNGVTSYDHTIDSSRNLWFRIFIPANAPSNLSLPVIVYFHGGGFVSFAPSTMPYNTFCRKIAGDVSAVVISVGYRLAPEHRWPAQYEDGFDVLKLLDDKEMREKIGVFSANADVSRCFLAGDSAGGNIIHHVAIRACGTHFKTIKIRGLISIQPFFGGEKRTESELRVKNPPVLTLAQTDFSWKAFLPIGSDRDHPAANILGPGSEDISGLESFPPTSGGPRIFRLAEASSGAGGAALQ
ncbi:probable carboxylesterase 18 [Chenopodium quinoa]|uniref:probable carboxylesterase 18 n=1 Tax=Chenopodium quinoa TaxID=63459 RepID=UPI000B7805B2|nr:probable carboxylesterase 18 [Chenopodium quinoa]